MLGVVAVRHAARVETAGRPTGEWRAGRSAAGGRGGRSHELRPIALLVAANGLCFMGPFQVLGPLIVRNRYHGGAAEVAMHWMLLPLGTIAARSACSRSAAS